MAVLEVKKMLVQILIEFGDIFNPFVNPFNSLALF